MHRGAFSLSLAGLAVDAGRRSCSRSCRIGIETCPSEVRTGCGRTGVSMWASRFSIRRLDDHQEIVDREGKSINRIEENQI